MKILWAALDWPFLVGTLLAALAWALMEIQIEGPHGWAKNLPTWRIEKHWLVDLLFGGGELTGYHLWAFLGVLVFFHMPFAAGLPWSISAEAHMLGSYAFFWIAEDYFWFVFNPHFGRKAFTKDRAIWHRRWFWNLPTNYWIMGLFGAALYFAPVWLPFT